MNSSAEQCLVFQDEWEIHCGPPGTSIDSGNTLARNNLKTLYHSVTSNLHKDVISY